MVHVSKNNERDGTRENKKNKKHREKDEELNKQARAVAVLPRGGLEPTLDE